MERKMFYVEGRWLYILYLDRKSNNYSRVYIG